MDRDSGKERRKDDFNSPENFSSSEKKKFRNELLETIYQKAQEERDLAVSFVQDEVVPRTKDINPYNVTLGVKTSRELDLKNLKNPHSPL